ncbi:MAG: HEAT repeat domain-containing protein [Planctomycetota bacterium]|nr:HEAT repeat domain-containing protein [Planctomycetota bacterium]
MHEELVNALIEDPNEAADDLLIEGLRLGTEIEQSLLLGALLTRKTNRGLRGVVERFDFLPERLQAIVLSNIKVFHHILRECGRSDRSEFRLAAIKLIALARQGKLAYVLSENLRDSDESFSKAAVEAMVALARWVATTTRKLQRGSGQPPVEEPSEAEGVEPPEPAPEPSQDHATLYADLIEQRQEIETAVVRAMEVHRGKHLQDLLRAALLLCDSPQSKILAILNGGKHAAQSLLVRRLQQTPASEHVDAFLLGASHGQLRVHFASVFAHIADTPVLNALLRKTHWLKDHQLQICMHQVNRGIWLQESELAGDIARRDPQDVGKIAEWITSSGLLDIVQDERLVALAIHAKDSVAGRLRLLSVAVRRKRGASVLFLKHMLHDGDERLMRMAAREIIRRKPIDYENMLLQLMTNAPESVRRVIGRSLGQAGFEHFWERFDRLDKNTRKQAGKAMLKILPDASQRLARRLNNGPVELRLKALLMTHELGLAEELRDSIAALASHPSPKMRSKAISVLGEVPSAPLEMLMERVLSDSDARVRANAIEVLETRPLTQFIPTLAQRAKSSNSRERANAIKALHRMKVGNVGPQLLVMLRDERAEHRISAMWALKQMGWWKLLQEVGSLAKKDDNIRVRRYAVGVLKGVVEMVQTASGKAG